MPKSQAAIKAVNTSYAMSKITVIIQFCGGVRDETRLFDKPIPYHLKGPLKAGNLNRRPPRNLASGLLGATPLPTEQSAYCIERV